MRTGLVYGALLEGTREMTEKKRGKRRANTSPTSSETLDRTGTFSSCEWDTVPQKPQKKKKSRLGSSALFKKYQGEYRWEGVIDQAYKSAGEEWAQVIRRVLLGEEEKSIPFHLRYFEIQPGGYSSLERHQHEHLVLGIRGRGKVRVGKECHELSFLDVLYIPPDLPHQLLNDRAEPFGFFCIVRAERDRPHLLDATERRLWGISAS